MRDLPLGYCPEWVRDTKLRSEVERVGFNSLDDIAKESILMFYMRMKGIA
jgi:hypothetical protein